MVKIIYTASLLFPVLMDSTNRKGSEERFYVEEID
jgi:hypothetical protein